MNKQLAYRLIKYAVLKNEVKLNCEQRQRICHILSSTPIDAPLIVFSTNVLRQVFNPYIKTYTLHYLKKGGLWDVLDDIVQEQKGTTLDQFLHWFFHSNEALSIHTSRYFFNNGLRWDCTKQGFVFWDVVKLDYESKLASMTCKDLLQWQQSGAICYLPYRVGLKKYIKWRVYGFRKFFLNLFNHE